MYTFNLLALIKACADLGAYGGINLNYVEVKPTADGGFTFAHESGVHHYKWFPDGRIVSFTSDSWRKK